MGSFFNMYEYREGTVDYSVSYGLIKLKFGEDKMDVNISIKPGFYSKEQGFDIDAIMADEKKETFDRLLLDEIKKDADGIIKLTKTINYSFFRDKGYEKENFLGIAFYIKGVLVGISYFGNEEIPLEKLESDAAKITVKATQIENKNIEAVVETEEDKEIETEIETEYIDAFSDDEYYDCKDITPKELLELMEKMGMDGSSIRNNSFLLHGYYNYKHILLAKKAEKPGRLYVGVPGTYSNQEKIMASMYGFESFKKSHRSDYRNPEFGYYF